MMAVRDVWRRDVLALSQGLEEELTELHQTRPAIETADTLDVFVQGLVRSWKDMGFSDDAIGKALRAGVERDFDLDPAWEEQRLQRQAWAAVSSESLGRRLSKVQSVSAVVGLMSFLGVILSAALWSWEPARVVMLTCTALLCAGVGLAWLIGKIQASRQARHLKELRRGLSDRTN